MKKSPKKKMIVQLWKLIKITEILFQEEKWFLVKELFFIKIKEITNSTI